MEANLVRRANGELESVLLFAGRRLLLWLRSLIGGVVFLVRDVPSGLCEESRTPGLLEGTLLLVCVFELIIFAKLNFVDVLLVVDVILVSSW